MKNQKNRQKYFLKIKLLKTLYLDIEENEWSDEKPSAVGYTPAYKYVKVNSIGKVYQEDNFIEIWGKNWPNTMKFKNIQEFMEVVGNWFQLA